MLETTSWVSPKGETRYYLSDWHTLVGLECAYYESGKLWWAMLNGQHIGKGLAREIMNTKIWFTPAGQVHVDQAPSASFRRMFASDIARAAERQGLDFLDGGTPSGNPPRPLEEPPVPGAQCPRCHHYVVTTNLYEAWCNGCGWHVLDKDDHEAYQQERDADMEYRAWIEPKLQRLLDANKKK